MALNPRSSPSLLCTQSGLVHIPTPHYAHLRFPKGNYCNIIPIAYLHPLAFFAHDFSSRPYPSVWPNLPIPCAASVECRQRFFRWIRHKVTFLLFEPLSAYATSSCSIAIKHDHSACGCIRCIHLPQWLEPHDICFVPDLLASNLLSYAYPNVYSSPVCMC